MAGNIDNKSNHTKKYPHFWGDEPEDESEYYKLHGIQSKQAFYTSPRGIKLFTRSWMPINERPRALVFMIHGYGNDISWTFQLTPIFLAKHGFACFAMDLPGHGRSQGLRAFVPDVDAVVQDCRSFFRLVRYERIFEGLSCFLYGESMGGALCLILAGEDGVENWDGAVLVAPMCKISDDIRPKWPLPQILTMLARIAPTLPIVPTADLVDKSVKVESKRIIATANPLRYNGKPRLGSVLELLRVTDCLSVRLSEVTVPFIVLHGSADTVTDPEVSRMLYDVAQSKDKSIKIYEGMLHSLMFGEPDENVALVRNDILAWLKERSRFS